MSRRLTSAEVRLKEIDRAAAGYVRAAQARKKRKAAIDKRLTALAASVTPDRDAQKKLADKILKAIGKRALAGE